MKIKLGLSKTYNHFYITPVLIFSWHDDGICKYDYILELSWFRYTAYLEIYKLQ